MAQTDIKELFRRAFGYEAPENFTIPKAPERFEQSVLGGEYYNDERDDVHGREYFIPAYLNNLLLPFAVVSITGKKLIISTAMPERQGSVIEQIAIDNYAIGIKGILVNDDNSFVDPQIIQLKELFIKNESLTLDCVLTDIFLNGAFHHKVVLKSLTFPPLGGVENARAYEMELESDMIFDLEEK